MRLPDGKELHGTHQETRLSRGTGKDESDRLARASTDLISRARYCIRKLVMSWRIFHVRSWFPNRVGHTLAFLEIHRARSHEACERKGQNAEIHLKILIDIVLSRVLFVCWREKVFARVAAQVLYIPGDIYTG